MTATGGDVTATVMLVSLLAVLLPGARFEGAGGTEATTVLAWAREGGFAGFCDRLSVQSDGVAVALGCRGREPEELGRCRLDAAERARLDQWVAELAPFTWEHTDPATADAMTVRLRLAGRGERETGPEERQAMLALAQALFARASG